MAYMRIFFFILFGVFILHTNAADKYTDENRPYEFGFTIDGEQHRHEKKDENGIIMGEFGFITADGVYHVTVYATDENGNFKILSMKNIRVKPYPTSPGTGAKREYSSNYSPAPKDSIPESTTAEKIIKHQIPSPAKSCSHCSLPPTTLAPTFQKEALRSTNNHGSASNNQNAESDKTKQIILPESRKYLQQSFDYQEQKDKLMPVSQITAERYPQIDVVSEGMLQTFNQGGEEHHNQHNNPMNTEQQKQNQEALLSNKEQNSSASPQTTNVPQTRHQDIPPISRNLQGPIKEDNLSQKQSVVQNNQPLLETNLPLQNRQQEQQGNYEHKQINENFENNDSILPRAFNNQEQKGKLMPVSQITADIYPQMHVVSEGILQTFNPGDEEYNNPMNTEQQKQKQEALLSKKEQNYPVAPQTATVSQPRNQDIPPISRYLQGPIKKDNLSQKQSVVQNNQPLLETNLPLQNRPQEQQGNYEQRSQINRQELPNYPNMYATDHQTTEQHDKPIDYSKNKQPIQKLTNADRNPKSFVNFIQQAEGPEDLSQTGPNLYRPSLPKPNTFSNKPELFAAQMQIVDKNTDVHHLNPGERVGLPTGLTKDDMSNLLYTFNYTVGFHGHHEKGYANGDKQGYYYVTGRNGVRTRVDYVADETGFHPKITQEILDTLSDDVPKPETEKDEKFGLKGYEFKWLYFPVEKKSK